MTQPGSARSRIRDLLQNPDTYATTLFLLAWDAHMDDPAPPKDENPAWLEWLPSHIIEELEEGYRVKAPPIAVHKMAIAQRLVLSNAFYKDVRCFIQVCNVLSGTPMMFGSVDDPADARECLWGIYEGMRLWEDEENPRDQEFTPEIEGYIQTQLDAEGISGNYILRGEVAVPGQFSGGDPLIEEAFGAAALENAKELQRWLAAEISDYRREIETVPLRYRATS